MRTELAIKRLKLQERGQKRRKFGFLALHRKVDNLMMMMMYLESSSATAAWDRGMG